MGEGEILIALAVGIMVVAGLFSWYFMSLRSIFEQRGIAIVAEITNLDTRRVPGLVFSRRGYFVGYTYFVSEGVRQAGNYQIRRAAYDQLKVGGTIKIRYMPEHPERSKPARMYLDDDAERGAATGCLWPASGAAIALCLIGMMSYSAAQNAVPTRSAAQSVSDALQEVHAALDTKIPGWQKSATKHTVRLSVTDAGFSSATAMREVYYGRCQTNHFYTYILYFIWTEGTNGATWLGSAYAYLPDGDSARDCRPEGWTISGDKPMEGAWHDVILVYPAQIPFYKLTATAEGQH